MDSFNDLKILRVNIRDIAIITVKNIDYCCIIHNIGRSEAVNLLKETVLSETEISVYSRL